MGVNAIVILENSAHVTLAEFIQRLQADAWGQRALQPKSDKNQGWAQFTWQGKDYFTWAMTPRARYLDLYGEHHTTGSVNTVQLTFLKIMLAAEKAAGGPIFVGNDVTNAHEPDEEQSDPQAFHLPLGLDWLMPNWRAVEAVDVVEPHLIF